MREAAMYSLADDGSQEAVAALKKVAWNDSSRDLQESALYAFADMDDGVAEIVAIARTHPDQDMRVLAVQVLGDADTKESRAALRELLED